MLTNKLSPGLVGKMVTMGWVGMDGSPQVRIARLETILRKGRRLTDKEVEYYYGKDENPEHHKEVKHDLFVFNAFFEPWFENGILESYNIIWSQKAWAKRGVKVSPFKI